jgi:Flp pilus assembly protein TadB
MKNITQKPDYGNWVPKRMLYLQVLVITLFIFLTIFIRIVPLQIVFCIVAVMCLIFFFYFYKAYFGTRYID